MDQGQQDALLANDISDSTNSDEPGGDTDATENESPPQDSSSINNDPEPSAESQNSDESDQSASNQQTSQSTSGQNEDDRKDSSNDATQPGPDLGSDDVASQAAASQAAASQGVISGQPAGSADDSSNEGPADANDELDTSTSAAPIFTFRDQTLTA